MIEITGTVQGIEKENDNGHIKNVVTLLTGKKNLLFIEFQGKSIYKTKSIKTGKEVSVKVVFNGKRSMLGRKYNNIIGKSIKHI